MTKDNNKHISSVTYSYLNKPEVITVSEQHRLTYVYYADGIRIQKLVYDDSTNTTEIYDYIGNFVYKDNVLQYILNEEGRERPVVDLLMRQPTMPMTTLSRII